MSTQETKTKVKAMSAEEMTEMLNALKLSTDNLAINAESHAQTLGELDSRVTKVEGAAQKAPIEDIAAAVAAKPGILGGLRQASTTKKVVIGTVATAAIAGAAYGGYKGYNYLQDRKASSVLEVEAAPLISPAKKDAIQQGLGVK